MAQGNKERSRTDIKLNIWLCLIKDKLFLANINVPAGVSQQPLRHSWEHLFISFQLFSLMFEIPTQDWSILLWERLPLSPPWHQLLPFPCLKEGGKAVFAPQLRSAAPGWVWRGFSHWENTCAGSWEGQCLCFYHNASGNGRGSCWVWWP